MYRSEILSNIKIRNLCRFSFKIHITPIQTQRRKQENVFLVQTLTRDSGESQVLYLLLDLVRVRRLSARQLCGLPAFRPRKPRSLYIVQTGIDDVASAAAAAAPVGYDVGRLPVVYRVYLPRCGFYLKDGLDLLEMKVLAFRFVLMQWFFFKRDKCLG